MLERIEHGPILELQLARKPVNALNPALIALLRQAIEQAPSQGIEGIVLSGSPGVFSAGLDVPALVKLDRRQMSAFWSDFSATMRAIACSPVPTVAAITGHSPAGGAVLAIWCDYRVMAEGEFRIGLNETQVGLAIPPPIIAGLQRLVGPFRGERLVAEGSMLDAGQALACGMVDQLVPLASVTETAVGWLQRHLALPRHAFTANRTAARRDLVQLFEEPTPRILDDFLDGWFGPQTQTALQALVAQLQAKH
ncbi:MAG: enoyl-CoA hydratase/isomerase family protein [Xanthomonadales bacterium]|nr:enoyl-CoA hydratase/isomerase family protein [Xanthomonadales bacterium]